LLAGVLNGAAFGSDVIDHRVVSDRAANTGQAIIVLRPDLFRDLHEFTADVERHLDEMRAAGDKDAVHIPGDGAAALEERNRRDGLMVPETLLVELRALSSRLDLDDDLAG
jgi:LDH2 family malate/lactate/ureidoglycolate dehydrogenase